MIIDFHVHCFPDELAPRAVEILADTANIPPRLNGKISDLKNSMRKSKVDKSVVLSIATKPSQTKKINDWSVDIQDDEVISFGSIHPENSDWKEELQRIKASGVRGIKFHPDYQNFFVDEKRMYPIYDFAAELGLIILFHAGVDIGLPAPYKCTPDRLLSIVRTFKGARFVAAHLGGFNYWDDVEKYLLGEDIYLDTSYCLGHISNDQAVRIIKSHGYEKFLFATDSPWADQQEEIGRIQKLDLSGEIKDAILGENARFLLNI